MVGIVGEIKQINFSMELTLSIFYVIIIYGFIIWLLRMWNNE